MKFMIIKKGETFSKMEIKDGNYSKPVALDGGELIAVRDDSEALEKFALENNIELVPGAEVKTTAKEPENPPVLKEAHGEKKAVKEATEAQKKKGTDKKKKGKK